MIRKRKRRPAYRRSWFWLLCLLLLLFARLWYDNRTVGVTAYQLADPAIPAAFDGYRIAQVSDLHGNQKLYKQLLSALEEAAPDLIAITGDLTDGTDGMDGWPALQRLLAEMGRIAPLYYVSGNHEWADLDAEDFFSRLEAAGVVLLRNDWVKLTRAGEALLLAGVEDPNGYADMLTPSQVAQRLFAAEPGCYSILLSHRPGRFPEYADLGFRLVLSGHNHGGLVRLPFLGGLFSPGGFLPRYDGGLFTLGDSRMLVSRGLSGSMGLPRFWNQPELPLVILRQGEKEA